MKRTPKDAAFFTAARERPKVGTFQMVVGTLLVLMVLPWVIILGGLAALAAWDSLIGWLSAIRL